MRAGPPPMRLLLLSSLLQALAAGTAMLLARRRTEHRPIGYLLIVATVANMILTGFLLGGFPTAPSSEPLTGFARVFGHLRQALYLVSPFGPVAAFVAVF